MNSLKSNGLVTLHSSNSYSCKSLIPLHINMQISMYRIFVTEFRSDQQENKWITRNAIWIGFFRTLFTNPSPCNLFIYLIILSKRINLDDNNHFENNGSFIYPIDRLDSLSLSRTAYLVSCRQSNRNASVELMLRIHSMDSIAIRGEFKGTEISIVSIN